MKDFQHYADTIMPNYGNANTLEGEVVRALCKIRYRYYNDGDHPTEGYGIETCGYALVFLYQEAPDHIARLARELEDKGGEPYEKALKALEDAVAVWINEQEAKGELEKVQVDMSDEQYSDEAAEKWEREPECIRCGSSWMIDNSTQLCEHCLMEEEEEYA
jgi:hypothetical protein